ncbi:MAG: s-methyl-5-thioribose-1-phosphate isomerase [Clostridiaceae bacterium]|nr:s-methyl-5-thioribose-1-phosphate isomerase [Clostridiaceae bacterium]
MRADEGLAFLLKYENVAWFEDGAVRILDRRVYPQTVRFEVCRSHTEVAKAIADMVTQSAGPLYAAAHGMALAAWEGRTRADLPDYLRRAAYTLSHARPTTAARMAAVTGECVALADEALNNGLPPWRALQGHAVALMERRYNAIGRSAALLCGLLPDACTVMTQCFAETVIGLLIRESRQRGKSLSMICPETRPYLQGARLTASVAKDQDCPVTVICDNMAAAVMQSGRAQALTSAADAICLDGTVVNKVGTCALALCARRFGLPYYVTGSPDRGKTGAADVEIEYRDENASLEYMGVRTTMDGVRGLYPAFDRTPADLVTAVITDRGVFSPDRLREYFQEGDTDFPNA